MKDLSAKEIKERRNEIRLVACPYCQAGPGLPCRSPSGYPLATVHAARRSAAADAGVYEVK